MTSELRRAQEALTRAVSLADDATRMGDDDGRLWDRIAAVVHQIRDAQVSLMRVDEGDFRRWIEQEHCQRPNCGARADVVIAEEGWCAPHAPLEDGEP